MLRSVLHVLLVTFLLLLAERFRELVQCAPDRPGGPYRPLVERVPGDDSIRSHWRERRGTDTWRRCSPACVA